MRANLFYGFWIIFLSAVLLENIVIVNGDIFDFPHLFSTGAITLFLVPPFSYLLHQHLMDPSRKMNIPAILGHCLPFIIVMLTMMPFFILSSEVKTEIIQRVYVEHQPVKGHYRYYSAFNIIQFIVYSVLIVRSLRASKGLSLKKGIRSKLDWMNLLTLIMNGLILAYAVLYVSVIYNIDYQFNLMFIFGFFLLVAIYVSAFQMIKNPFFFSSDLSVYKGSMLKDDVVSKLEIKLNELFMNQKPYLNPKVKLADVANDLGVHTHQLSQFLNQKQDTTFTQMINAARIEHAQNLLKSDPEKSQTILAIALDSGFNNQANFIRVFKEATGSTPSEYRAANPTIS